VVRSWTDITEQLARNVPLFTLTLVGVVDRQVDTAVETVESSARESLRGVEDLLSEAEDDRPQPGRESESPPTGRPEAERTEARKQGSKIDRRPFEERSVEELRDRARELEIEGRSAMSKDELVAALREHAK
jgi:hypothetical protein